MQPPPKAFLSWSSGKDAAFALLEARRLGCADIVGLLTTVNETHQRVAIHGLRRSLLHRQAAETGLPLLEIPLPHPCSNEGYEARMAAATSELRAEGLHGIAFGDLFLEDIRAYRIARLAGTGLEPIFPVWCPTLGVTTAELARQMLTSGLCAHLTTVDPRHLDPSFAGRAFDAQLLANLPSTVDPCGERGEFHTFVSAGPIFSRTISVIPGETVERDNYIYADLLPATASA